MSTFVDNIDKFCKARHITKADMLRDLGFPSSLTANWKHRGNMPSAETIHKIAVYFGVPMEYIMYGEGNPMDDDIVAAAAKLKTLTREQRQPIMDLIASQVDYWYNFYNKESTKN